MTNTTDIPPAVEFHVSADAGARGDGSRGRPFGSLETARDAVRALRKQAGGLPKGGVTVQIEPGVFFRDRAFELTSEDSGAPGAPVVYRGAGAARTRLTGGRRVEGFARVTDPDVLSRLPPAAARRVVVADLRAQGITDFGVMKPRGFGKANVPAALELFYNGRPMPLARWPNVDFLTIQDIPTEGSRKNEWGQPVSPYDRGFIFRDGRLTRWRPSPDLWVHGYWCWDWANSYERVASMDPATGLIRTAGDHEHYGFRTGQRFYFLNVLEELDAPGEWYLDRETGRLYFWPPSPLRFGEAWVSLLEQPLITLKDASHVVIRDMGLECVRGLAVAIAGGERDAVLGCAIGDCGDYGMRIKGGSDHLVAGCDISDTGDGGITITGGDRQTLAPCHHAVENCHLHHFGRWSRTYVPGVQFHGVGLRVAGNLFHDAPHTAILFSGNDVTIENNEIHSVCMETGDAGAIYTGRDYTFRGNVVRRNFIHHLGGVGMGTMGVYNDDCVSGTLMTSNVFYRLTRAVMMGGGRDLVAENNLFVDCDPAISFDARGVDKHPVWSKMVYGVMKERLEAVNWRQPPYAERYPEILDVEKYYATNAGVPPENCAVRRNVCVRGKWLWDAWHKSDNWLTQTNNVILDDDPGFADLARLDFRLPAESPAFARGFQPIPMQDIGLRADGDRRTVPPRELVHVRLEVVQPPVREAPGKPARAVVRASVENPGQAVAGGRVCLWLAPGSPARVRGRSDARYRIRPAGRETFDFTVELPGGADEVEAGAYLAGESFVRCRLAIRAAPPPSAK
jgi:hypothetical protein